MKNTNWVRPLIKVSPKKLHKTPENLSVIYRGPIAACNYRCWYCPSASVGFTPVERLNDEMKLSRFLRWVDDNADIAMTLSFQPRGESLIFRCYQQALETLSHQAHVKKVVFQTNLSMPLDWLKNCDTQKLAFSVSFHPSQIAVDEFMASCRELMDGGVAFSVGVVTDRKYMEAINQLRQALPPEVFIWVNRNRMGSTVISDVERVFYQSIDPFFGFTTTDHPSMGLSCAMGQEVLAVEADGTLRHCYFSDGTLGSIYQADWRKLLKARGCPNQTCSDFDGFAHLKYLNLTEDFGDRVFERIPIHLKFADQN